MKSILKLFSIFAVASILFAGSCSKAATTSHLPTTTSTSTQQGDDILTTPNGFAYRANVNQQGQTNPFTPIQTTDLALSGGHITYRSYIESAHGETRYNIVAAYQIFNGQSTPVISQLDMSLEFIGVPSGMNLTVADQWSGPGTCQNVLAIVISPQAELGDYMFSIEVSINGQFWSTIVCQIHVSD